MKPYLLTFNLAGITRNDVTKFLDTLPEVQNWYTAFFSAVIVISEADATTLANLFHARFPLVFFVVTEIVPSNCNGYLPKIVWEFITKPKSLRGEMKPPPVAALTA